MKGTIDLHEKWGWGVINHTDESIPDWIPLHPDDLTYFAEMNERFDNFEARVLSSPEVEFEFIELPKFTGRIIYAKLITKEEPKQESPEEPTMIDDWLNEYGDPEIYKKVERELELREAARKYAEPKQETLEEAALKWFMTANKREIIFDLGWIKIFEAGACWQEKRMYSEEEVEQIVLEALQSALVTVDIKQWFKQFKKK